MKVKKEFIYDGDRYIFDFKHCTIKNGYAQIDTGQDAWYYGTWANPFGLKFVCYCEGDLSVEIADNKKEFVEKILSFKKWNEENGWKFKGIDPGFNVPLKKEFEILGLGNLLH